MAFNPVLDPALAEEIKARVLADQGPPPSVPQLGRTEQMAAAMVAVLDPAKYKQIVEPALAQRAGDQFRSEQVARQIEAERTDALINLANIQDQMIGREQAQARLELDQDKFAQDTAEFKAGQTKMAQEEESFRNLFATEVTAAGPMIDEAKAAAVQFGNINQPRGALKSIAQELAGYVAMLETLGRELGEYQAAGKKAPTEHLKAMKEFMGRVQDARKRLSAEQARMQGQEFRMRAMRHSVPPAVTNKAMAYKEILDTIAAIEQLQSNPDYKDTGGPIAGQFTQYGPGGEERTDMGQLYTTLRSLFSPERWGTALTGTELGTALPLLPDVKDLWFKQVKNISELKRQFTGFATTRRAELMDLYGLEDPTIDRLMGEWGKVAGRKPQGTPLLNPMVDMSYYVGMPPFAIDPNAQVVGAGEFSP